MPSRKSSASGPIRPAVAQSNLLSYEFVSSGMDLINAEATGDGGKDDLLESLQVRCVYS